jgi:hypothetical protein
MRACSGATIAIAAAASLAACGGGGNPLLGKWIAVPGNPDGCDTDMNFTATTLIRKGQPDIAVSYSASPTKVYVVTDAGLANHTTFLIDGPDRVTLDTPFPCHFQRAG